MKKKSSRLVWKVAGKISDLPKKDAKLLALATSSLDDAYAPYSKFHVGAAVLLKNGKMIGGSNQENAAYPMCLCAERVALSAAASRYPKMLIHSMAITVKAPHQIVSQPAMPCGACRQALCELEFQQKNTIKLVIRGEEGVTYVFKSAKDLLPFSFDASFL